MKTKILFGVLATLLTAHTLFADSKSETLAEIEELKAKIAELEGGNTAVVQVKKNVELLKQEEIDKKREILEIESQLSELNFLYNVYKSAYRIVPTISKGTPLGSIRLPNGIVVSNALFSGPTQGGIAVTTASGSATIPLEQIPAEHTDKFNLPSAIPAAPQSTLQDLAATRPNDLLGPIPGSEENEVSNAAKMAENSAPAPADAGNKVAAAEEEIKSEYQAKVARNTVRWNRINELKTETRRILEEQKKLRSKKKAVEREFSKKRIKPDPNVVARELAVFDKDIEKLDERENDILDEIARLRREVE